MISISLYALLIFGAVIVIVVSPVFRRFMINSLPTDSHDSTVSASKNNRSRLILDVAYRDATPMIPVLKSKPM